MTVEVVEVTPTNVTVTDASASITSVEVPVVTAEVRAHISQPQVGGMFVELIGEDDWTIWFEDGK